MTIALGLLSGGLDSTLAAKVLIDQGIEVHAINFTSPFCTCSPKSSGCSAVQRAVEQLGNIPLKRVAVGEEYLTIVKSPRYGWGRGVNPCIDCRILKLKLAATYMREIGASFLFTGEVLGQRPMSQHKKALTIIEKNSGLKGLILRPLSAAVLPPTIPEEQGLVDRSMLLALEGRSRKPQIALAAEKGIADYPCPNGGCLLTNEHFAEKMKAYLVNRDPPSLQDMPLLKIGRHFWPGNHEWIVVSRNEEEGMTLEKLCRPTDRLFVPVDFPGPTVLLRGSNETAAIAQLLAYSKKVDRPTRQIEHRLGAQSVIHTHPSIEEISSLDTVIDPHQVEAG
jgi:tRNA-specific 2-thiouridylase